MNLKSLREYKFYCIGQYKETGDKYYLQEKRRLDKEIKRKLQEEE